MKLTWTLTRYFAATLSGMVLLSAAAPAQQSQPAAPPTVGAKSSAASGPASQPAATGQAKAGAASKPASAPAPMPSLIQTVPDYSGDLLTRKYLTGDWGGTRTELANQGIFFEFGATQGLQGNAYGGKDTNNALRYGGSADYIFKFDTARMKLWPGGLITLHAETSFGHGINGKTGAILAPNYDALVPQPNNPGLTTLSEVSLTQALSEKLVVMLGKLDMTAGDPNEFAHDERTQFMNAAFRANPMLFNAAPYTTMGVGVIWLPTEWATLATFLTDNDPDGAATRTGFNTAFHGREWYSLMQELDLKVKPFGLPGNQRFGWYYTTRDFADLTADPRISLPVSRGVRGVLSRRLVPRWLRAVQIGSKLYDLRTPETRPDDWGVYYNFDQYLFTEAEDHKQGWGVFGRFGWTTGEANVFEQFYSLGLGGKGSIPCRDKDTWGLGYYCANMSSDLGELINVSSEQGVELFYNIEVTPWLHITPDVQVIVDPGAGFGNREPAVVYGLRAQMSF